MEIRLYIARHAHADPGFVDETRPLSDKGKKQVRRLCDGFSRSGLLRPESIWHSGLVRAEETARGLANGLKLEIPLIQKRGLSPFDDPASILALIDSLHRSTLIVGHDPNLSFLAKLLIDPNLEREPLVFLKGSVLCLSRLVVGSQHTPWQIEWHISHRFFK